MPTTFRKAISPRNTWSFSESAQAMKEGKIDAAFITAAIPTPAVTNLDDSIGVRVLSIDPFAVNVLTKRHSYYTPCMIPANTYAGQSEAAQTVGVRARGRSAQ